MPDARAKMGVRRRSPAFSAIIACRAGAKAPAWPPPMPRPPRPMPASTTTGAMAQKLCEASSTAPPSAVRTAKATMNGLRPYRSAKSPTARVRAALATAAAVNSAPMATVEMPSRTR